MKLRTVALILTLALGLVAASLPAEAQRMGRVYKVGLLISSFGDIPMTTRLPWLAELGYVEGENVRFEHRFAAVCPAAIQNEYITANVWRPQIGRTSND